MHKTTKMTDEAALTVANSTEQAAIVTNGTVVTKELRVIDAVGRARQIVTIQCFVSEKKISGVALEVIRRPEKTVRVVTRVGSPSDWARKAQRSERKK